MFDDYISVTNSRVNNCLVMKCLYAFTTTIKALTDPRKTDAVTSSKVSYNLLTFSLSALQPGWYLVACVLQNGLE